MAFFKKRRFAFVNYGGTYQLRIRTAEDLAALEDLDEAFWIATSAPVDQFTSDPMLLERLDHDGTGRIQSCEIREASRWLLRMLRDREGVTERREALDLDALDTGHADGRGLYEAARRILSNLGEPGGKRLSLAQVRDRQAIFAGGAHNGDGIIPPESVADPELKTFVEDIMATVGSATDLNGSAGVNKALLDTFLENARALRAWQQRCENDANSKSLFPFGEATAARHALYKSLAHPIDSYFQRCRMVALNEILKRKTEEPPCPPDILDDDERTAAYLAEAPLSRPRAYGVLVLKEDVNPHYEQAVIDLTNTVLAPLLGADFNGAELYEEQWKTVKQAFEGYERWLDAKSGGQVETLGPDSLQSYLDGDLPQHLSALIDEDLSAGPELAALRDLEYLILLQRWFLDLCNNFVSFPALYTPGKRAMFETGRLVMGGKFFNFNFKLPDVNTHSVAAARSGIYLLYSEVTGAADDQRFFVVTPVTRGSTGDFGVGKRGVLFDLDGREWDTTVVKVVENPVSIGEAMVSPFKRLGALISSTTEKISTGAEKQLESQITKTTASVETGIEAGIAAPPAAPAPAAAPAVPAGGARASGTGGIRDMMLAGGLAVAALGSSFAFIAKTISDMEPWHIGVALAVGLAIVLIPTTLVAFFKLRRRNLSAILEASGWAINAPMRLTRGLSQLIVQDPPHPKSFGRVRKDLTGALAKAVRLERPSKG